MAYFFQFFFFFFLNQRYKFDKIRDWIHLNRIIYLVTKAKFWRQYLFFHLLNSESYSTRPVSVKTDNTPIPLPNWKNNIKIFEAIVNSDL